MDDLVLLSVIYLFIGLYLVLRHAGEHVSALGPVATFFVMLFAWPFYLLSRDDE